MDLGLSKRTALVLGAGGGLGSAIAVALASEGARVAVAGRNEEALEAVKRRIDQANGTACAVAWDLADLDGIDKRVAHIETTLGPIDILINITGGPQPTTAHGVDIQMWQREFEAMVLSVMAITDRVVPGMRDRRHGRVIISTSSGVVAPIPNLAISNALRLALVGWAKTLAREVAGDGVTVNTVVPGRIATSRVRYLDETKAKREGRGVDEVMRESAASIPAGRYGTPDEYAAAVTFLAGAQASYITGSILRVDGGLIASI